LRAALDGQVKLVLLNLLDAHKLTCVVTWVGTVSRVKPRVEESVLVGSERTQLDTLLLLLRALFLIQVGRLQGAVARVVDVDVLAGTGVRRLHLLVAWPVVAAREWRLHRLFV
jgi:hypothetical protein